MQQREIEYIAPAPGRIDPRDPLDLAKVITQAEADQVISLASYRAGSQLAVQYAEADPDGCELVNHQQAALIAEVCDHLHIPLVHLSTRSEEHTSELQ